MNGWGTTAYIVTRSAHFCSTPPSDPEGLGDAIFAWSATADGETPPSSLYAQSGYISGRPQSGTDTSYEIFAEFGTNTTCRDGGSTFCRYVSPTTTSDGDNYAYYQIYGTSSNEMLMYYYDGTNRTKLLTTNYDPTASGPDHWTDGWQHEWAGETHNSGSDVPGSATTKASFTSLGYASSGWNETGTPSFTDIGGSYPNKNIFATEGYYCFGHPSGQPSFNIWTSGSC